MIEKLHSMKDFGTNETYYKAGNCMAKWEIILAILNYNFGRKSNEPLFMGPFLKANSINV